MALRTGLAAGVPLSEGRSRRRVGLHASEARTRGAATSMPNSGLVASGCRCLTWMLRGKHHRFIWTRMSAPHEPPMSHRIGEMVIGGVSFPPVGKPGVCVIGPHAEGYAAFLIPSTRHPQLSSIPLFRYVPTGCVVAQLLRTTAHAFHPCCISPCGPGLCSLCSVASIVCICSSSCGYCAPQQYGGCCRTRTGNAHPYHRARERAHRHPGTPPRSRCGDRRAPSPLLRRELHRRAWKPPHSAQGSGTRAQRWSCSIHPSRYGHRRAKYRRRGGSRGRRLQQHRPTRTAHGSWSSLALIQ